MRSSPTQTRPGLCRPSKRAKTTAARSFEPSRRCRSSCACVGVALPGGKGALGSGRWTSFSPPCRDSCRQAVPSWPRDSSSVTLNNQGNVRDKGRGVNARTLYSSHPLGGWCSARLNIVAAPSFAGQEPGDAAPREEPCGSPPRCGESDTAGSARKAPSHPFVRPHPFVLKAKLGDTCARERGPRESREDATIFAHQRRRVECLYRAHTLRSIQIVFVVETRPPEFEGKGESRPVQHPPHEHRSMRVDSQAIGKRGYERSPLPFTQPNSPRQLLSVSM